MIINIKLLYFLNFYYFKNKIKKKNNNIKVESIIREDFNIESLEILSLCFLLLNTRLLLLNEKE